MKKGLLIILSGPSGVGKGTVRRYFENDERLNLAYSTSMTTREPRNGEIDGKDYFFTSRQDFENAIKNEGGNSLRGVSVKHNRMFCLLKE